MRSARPPVSCLSVLVAALCVPSAVRAQAPGASPPAEAKARSIPPRKTFELHRAREPITIDGALDEPAWSEATVVDLPFEYFPGDNVAPPVKTECLVTYDASNFYV